MNKEKLFYDIINIIMAILIIVIIIFMINTFNEKIITEGVDRLKGITTLMSLSLPYILFYTIAMIILALRKERTFGGKIIFIILSIFFVGIAPLLFYFFGLRKKIVEKI